MFIQPTIVIRDTKVYKYEPQILFSILPLIQHCVIIVLMILIQSDHYCTSNTLFYPSLHPPIPSCYHIHDSVCSIKSGQKIIRHFICLLPSLPSLPISTFFSTQLQCRTDRQLIFLVYFFCPDSSFVKTSQNPHQGPKPPAITHTQA